MTTDFSVTQQWAELIANHPAAFDGIHYRSRHSDQPCLVIWTRPDGSGPVSESAFSLKLDGEFIYSASAYSLAEKMGLKLAFV
jgi:hypothetical protein